jgi:hypothetical protein
MWLECVACGWRVQHDARHIQLHTPSNVSETFFKPSTIQTDHYHPFLNTFQATDLGACVVYQSHGALHSILVSGYSLKVGTPDIVPVHPTLGTSGSLGPRPLQTMKPYFVLEQRIIADSTNPKPKIQIYPSFYG